ncbi:MAG: hypothetical protein LAT68_06620 [Cyclobacteriaceae bacterium]|nr:hypothetical protein [Cyclobacteriaceae bacterium]MCH8515985.1 hypothetical protein [Cyclobacteriaceae bacterium]
MKKVSHYFIYFLIYQLSGCAPAGVGTGTSKAEVGTYQEDISSLRPILTNEEREILNERTANHSPAKTEKVERVDVMPQYDITASLDEYLEDIFTKKQTSIRGYSILVYSGADRAAATRARDVLMAKKQLKGKLTYNQPNYIVTYGKFTDRIDAQKTFNEVRDVIPSARMMPTTIRY